MKNNLIITTNSEILEALSLEATWLPLNVGDYVLVDDIEYTVVKKVYDSENDQFTFTVKEIVV